MCWFLSFSPLFYGYSFNICHPLLFEFSFDFLNCTEQKFFVSLNLLTYVQGFIRRSFDRDFVELGHFLFPPPRREFHFKTFFRDTRVKLLDITFSIMNGDRFVDSITMNLGKSNSASLSEESNSEWFRLNFLFEEAICIIYFSLVLCSTTHHEVQLVLVTYQGGSPFALVEVRIHYLYTRVESKILSLC